jgi:hypothetical protein
MPANLILSDDGIQFAGGAIVDVKASIPTSGTWNAGSIVLESTTSARISGWKRLTTGSGHVLNTDWSYFSGNPINSGTAVATTSGTSIDFTGIPAGVKRVTLSLALTSTNGTSAICTQIGDSGGVETTGYTSTFNNIAGGAAATSTAAVGLMITGTAASVFNGQVVYTLLDAATNLWVISGVLSDSSPTLQMGTGSKALSGVLDRIRLTTLTGVNTFDGGSANILWEF